MRCQRWRARGKNELGRNQRFRKWSDWAVQRPDSNNADP
jgi:hypothetical protein